MDQNGAEAGTETVPVTELARYGTVAAKGLGTLGVGDAIRLECIGNLADPTTFVTAHISAVALDEATTLR